MWTKYDYLCTNCDTLIEITTQHQSAKDPYCVCAESAVIRINKHNVTHKKIAEVG